MGKRKKSTHKLKLPRPTTGFVKQTIPRSFVIALGKVSKDMKHIVRDMRRIMNPHTAIDLKVNRWNTLKDFVHGASPFGVTHIFVFDHAYGFDRLKIMRLPSGPNLHFEILQYSTSAEVRTTDDSSSDDMTNYATPPLLLLHQLSSDVIYETCHQVIKSSIPPLPLIKSNLRRILLYHMNDENKEIDVRHYSVHGHGHVSNNIVKAIHKGQLPDASQYSTMAEAWSDLQHDNDNDDDGGGVQLRETGPRLKLKLIMIESNKKVLYCKEGYSDVSVDEDDSRKRKRKIAETDGAEDADDDKPEQEVQDFKFLRGSEKKKKVGKAWIKPSRKMDDSDEIN